MSNNVREARDVSPLDPTAKPLFEALQTEYAIRYADFLPNTQASTKEELERYPADLFVPPEGAFLLIVEGNEVIGGGAFKRYDATTAELKRIWTRDDQRRRGVASRVVSELEARALKQGYQRVYLTTGFRQPEAVALYLRSRYEPLYDRSIAPEVHFRLPFGKDLTKPGRIDTLADLRASGPLGLPHADSPAPAGTTH